jgi:hypothetical protein
MGWAKEQMIIEQDRGWSSIDKQVCAGCISDDDLRQVIQDAPEDEPCSYCGQQPSAPVDTLMEAIDAGIRSEWSVAADSNLYWDGREGGYQGVDVSDSYDLIHDLGISENEELIQDLVDAYVAQATEWVRTDFWRVDRATMWLDAWQAFSNVVKHESRFVFLLDPKAQQDYGDDYIPPGRFLERLGELVAELRLIRRLPAGTEFYRARVHDPTVAVKLPEGLAAPMRGQARFANRMSPVGIPMFYGASDRETCLAELGYAPPQTNEACTAGVFKTAREFSVLDLTKIPPVPGMFEPNEELAAQRPTLVFLQGFQRDISKPIVKDDRAHVEYVPTQIVTEFFRRVSKDENGEPVRGILYPSAQRAGGTACVLFFENEGTCSIHPGWEDERDEVLAGTAPHSWWLGLEIDSVETLVQETEDS